MHATPQGGRPVRVLVVAAATPETTELPPAVARAAGGGPAEAVVIAPALNSRIRTLFSDERAARRDAGERLERCLAGLTGAGIASWGRIGDPDPMMAIRDAQVEFGPGAIVVVTCPTPDAHPRARDLAQRTRLWTALPVTSLEARPRAAERPRRPPAVHPGAAPALLP